MEGGPWKHSAPGGGARRTSRSWRRGRGTARCSKNRMATRRGWWCIRSERRDFRSRNRLLERACSGSEPPSGKWWSANRAGWPGGRTRLISIASMGEIRASLGAACSCRTWRRRLRCWRSRTFSDLLIEDLCTHQGVVPGTQLRLINAENGEAWGAVANDSGNYIIPLVKPGQHVLTPDKPGFKGFQQTGIVLETGGQSRIDVTLEVGSVTERVEVQATAPLLQSETSAVGAVIENHTIINMPLINRRAAQLARLSGFVVQNGTGSNFTMPGGRGDNSMWLIDGANAQNVLLGVQTLRFDPPIESLQEFNVAISNYSAELGRTGGGVVQ